MSSYKKVRVDALVDAATGALAGFMGGDGQEYLIPLIYYPNAATNFNDTSATPGNATINSARGRFSVAAAATSCTITNAQCKTTSYVNINVSTNDATCVVKNIVPSNGSFTVNLVGATAQTNLDFILLS